MTSLQAPWWAALLAVAVLSGIAPGVDAARLHVNVNGAGATAGCVSVPRALQRRVLDWLRPRSVPVIAIGD